MHINLRKQSIYVFPPYGRIIKTDIEITEFQENRWMSTFIEVGELKNCVIRIITKGSENGGLIYSMITGITVGFVMTLRSRNWFFTCTNLHIFVIHNKIGNTPMTFLRY